MNKNLTNQGFMKVILLAIVIIAGLAYFSVDLRGILDNQPTQKVLGVLSGAWYGYLVPLWAYLGTSVAGLFN